MAALPANRDFAAEMAGAPVQVVDMSSKDEENMANRTKPRISFQNVFKQDTADEPPEELLMDTMAMRPRSLSHHLRSTEVPSRKWLIVKARFWRFLMSLGMPFHGFARPLPPRPAFVRRIMTDTIPIELLFYTPKDYKIRKERAPNHRYPLVVNFHGGGFCLGDASDDKYWARVVLRETQAVFVSVNYRRAPEHPFPQPVDDCVEALLYLQSHAEELRIDPSQTALSGFSAGGNLAFTVPFRLTYQYERQPSSEHLPLEPRRKNESNFVPEPLPSVGISNADRHEQELGLLTPLRLQQTNHSSNSPWASMADLHQIDSTRPVLTSHSSRTNLLNLPGPRSKLLRTLTQDTHNSRRANMSQDNLHCESPERDPIPRLRIVSILAWYPLLDWTASRSEKKRGSRMPKKTLPAVFTDLFDFSYLPAPDREGHHCSPYASPALAPDHMIIDGLPQRIQMWLCEWDMLLAEGERFRDKLRSFNKDVFSEVIPGVPHGWDKSPNPFRDQKSIDELYTRAAGQLRGVFGLAERRQTVGEGIGLGGLR